MEKGYIFDLGRVLANFDLDIAFEKFCEYSDRETNVDLIETTVFDPKHKHIIIDFELGLISPQQFHQQWTELLGLRIDFDEFKKIWGSVFTENTPMKQVLERIRGNPKVILSNIDPIHWEVVKEFEIVKNYFAEENCIRSYQINLRKPNKEIFLYAKEKLADCSKIVYIDDIEDYGMTAAELGITPVQYDCRHDTFEDINKTIH